MTRRLKSTYLHRKPNTKVRILISKWPRVLIIRKNHSKMSQKSATLKHCQNDIHFKQMSKSSYLQNIGNRKWSSLLDLGFKSPFFCHLMSSKVAIFEVQIQKQRPFLSPIFRKYEVWSEYHLLAKIAGYRSILGWFLHIKPPKQNIMHPRSIFEIKFWIWVFGPLTFTHRNSYN